MLKNEPANFEAGTFGAPKHTHTQGDRQLHRGRRDEGVGGVGDRHEHRRHNRERSKVVKEALLALVHILCK